jgi:hypothetical protein
MGQGGAATSIATAVALAWLASASVARAEQPAARDPASAAELFRQGRAALLEKRYDAACAALAESERLDAKVGTLINLALCEEARGKLASALDRWDDAVRLAHASGDEREAYASKRRGEITARVPRLIIRVVSGAPAATHVRLDGVELAQGDLGVARGVDPGEHTVLASAPEGTERKYVVDVREGASREIFVAPGEPARPVEAPTSSSGGTQRVVAYAIGGAGLVGVVIGGVFGMQAINARNDPRCTDGVCDAAGAQVQRDGMRAGNIATVAFVAGGALLAGGVTLWLTAPKPKAPRTAAWIGGAGGAPAVGIGGVW